MLIPARGGSKGLPRKNIRTICGKPLINWSVEVGLGSTYVDAVVVSTDDAEIAQIAKEAGAEVPFMRPEYLAEDRSSSIDVIMHALDTLADEGRVFDIILLLEPTSPLREVSDINDSLARLISADEGSIVSVCRAESTHPCFMYKLDANQKMIPYSTNQPTNLRRQDIEPLFFLEGSIYASWVHTFKKEKSFYHDKTVAYQVEKWKSFEIDDIYDFVIVEALLKNKSRLNDDLSGRKSN